MLKKRRKTRCVHCLAVFNKNWKVKGKNQELTKSITRIIWVCTINLVLVSVLVNHQREILAITNNNTKTQVSVQKESLAIIANILLGLNIKRHSHLEVSRELIILDKMFHKTISLQSSLILQLLLIRKTNQLIFKLMMSWRRGCWVNTRN